MPSSIDNRINELQGLYEALNKRIKTLEQETSNIKATLRAFLHFIPEGREFILFDQKLFKKWGWKGWYEE